MDRAGRTVDFRLGAKRDVAAAKAFFRKAIKGQHDAPRTITLDGYAASHRAVRELKADGLLPAETKLRSSKYLNNLIEQDHRGVKQRIATMLGFKGFATAAITIGGFRREVQPRRQHWFLNEMSGFPFRTPAFCSVSRGRRRLGEKEYRATVTPGLHFAPELRIAGIELMHRIRKGQVGLGRLGVQDRLAPAVWNAVLQA